MHVVIHVDTNRTDFNCRLIGKKKFGITQGSLMVHCGTTEQMFDG